jgi:hypothetical protein
VTLPRRLLLLLAAALMALATAVPAASAAEGGDPALITCGFTDPEVAIADPLKPGASEITLLKPQTPNRGGGGPPC